MPVGLERKIGSKLAFFSNWLRSSNRLRRDGNFSRSVRVWWETYLTTESEDSASDLGNVLLLPKINSLEDIDIRYTVLLEGLLETVKKKALRKLFFKDMLLQNSTLPLTTRKAVFNKVLEEA